MRTIFGMVLGTALAGSAVAAEVTVKNDSLTNFSSAVVQAGFVAGESAASWLTSPCAGTIVAAQVFWSSGGGNTGQVLGGWIEIYRAGTFPNPGILVEEIAGPVLTDGVINEYRFLDDNNTIPLAVPVAANETFVLAYRFFETPPIVGPSVANDIDGNQPNRNAIHADIGGTLVWLASGFFGVGGDWILRAVIDCPVVSNNADVSAEVVSVPASYVAGAPLAYTVTLRNAGPAASPNTTVVDVFPSSLTGVSWTCTATGGASCVPAGSGSIAHSVALPAAGQVVYAVQATVAAGTTGDITNTVTTVVGPPAIDPVSTNNASTAITPPADTDLVFADGFDGAP